MLLVRHAETEWTISHRHTGRADIALTVGGRRAAADLAPILAPLSFALVLVSPSRRARETCELAGLGGSAVQDEALLEWNYGEYEGLTRAEIDGCPGGERAEDVGRRADRAIATALASPGPVAVFSHGHMLRVLGSRWAGLPAAQGARLGLAPGAMCRLGHEHGTRIIARWNQLPGGPLD
jgi:probable phosphoglycerate mutase